MVPDRVITMDNREMRMNSGDTQGEFAKVICVDVAINA